MKLIRQLKLLVKAFFDSLVEAEDLILARAAFSEASLVFPHPCIHCFLYPQQHNGGKYFAANINECNTTIVVAVCGVAFLG